MVVFFGPKGGVGATTLACNVGGASTSKGYNFVTDLSCGLGGATDTESLVIDPLVVPGGLVLPFPGSPLHDAVPASKCTVVDDVPAGAVVAGIPARVVRISAASS